MPQANVTYKNAYNQSLVKTLRELENKKFNLDPTQYHPTPMGFRNADSFHAPAKVKRLMTGGVAPSKYILNGNSPAYPPIDLNAGMAVSSGGSRYAGIDGAVSGGRFNFGSLVKGARDITDMGKSALQLAAVAAPLMAASSGGLNLGKALKTASKGVKTAAKVAKQAKEAKKLYDDVTGGFNIDKAFKTASKGAKTAVKVAKQAKEAKKLYDDVTGGFAAGEGDLMSKSRALALRRKMVSGGNIMDVFNIAKAVAPFAVKRMVGGGCACPKMSDKLGFIKDAMEELKGGSFWSDFGKGFKKGFTGTLGLAKDIAPIAVPLMMAAGRAEYGSKFNFGKFLTKAKDTVVKEVKRRGKKALAAAVGGASVNLNDAIEATKRMGSPAFVAEAKKRGRKAVKNVVDDVKASVVRQVTGRGRSVRADIVKKIMAEKGLKMIAASKYVKEHGLY